MAGALTVGPQPPHVADLLRKLDAAVQAGEVSILESGHPLFRLLWELLTHGTPWWVREQPGFLAFRESLGAVEEPLMQLISEIEQEAGRPYGEGGAILPAPARW